VITKNPMTKKPTRVLIVDDEPRNLALLEAVLAPLGIETRRAANGREAVALFRDLHALDEVDLVLLDVMMPELDGFGALAEMRNCTSSGERIPIVLVTALAAREDRMRGLEAGADDFLSKPLDPHEVRCRVRTFVALREAQRTLRQRAEELERVQQARADLSRLIVHDLKNPLAALQGNLQWVRSRAAKGNDAMMLEAIDDSTSSTTRLLTMIGTLIDVDRVENSQLRLDRKPTRVCDLLEAVARRHARDAELRGVTIHVTGDAELRASIDCGVLERAIENLVENAARFAGTPGKIELSVSREGAACVIGVANTGVAIPEATRARMFEKYATTEKNGHHQGLGLYFCRLASEAHGGRIAVTSDATWPTRFRITIPDQAVRATPAFVD
jgi:two-component system sensor histidine kinase/response regulator